MTYLQAYNAEKAGAKAIIVADYKDERLLTMAVPEDRPEIAALKNDITIPTALITQARPCSRNCSPPAIRCCPETYLTCLALQRCLASNMNRFAVSA